MRSLMLPIITSFRRVCCDLLLWWIKISCVLVPVLKDLIFPLDSWLAVPSSDFASLKPQAELSDHLKAINFCLIFEKINNNAANSLFWELKSQRVYFLLCFASLEGPIVRLPEVIALKEKHKVASVWGTLPALGLLVEGRWITLAWSWGCAHYDTLKSRIHWP